MECLYANVKRLHFHGGERDDRTGHKPILNEQTRMILYSSIREKLQFWPIS